MSCRRCVSLCRVSSALEISTFEGQSFTSLAVGGFCFKTKLNIQTYVHVGMNVCMYVCMHVCMFVCIVLVLVLTSYKVECMNET